MPSRRLEKKERNLHIPLPTGPHHYPLKTITKEPMDVDAMTLDKLKLECFNCGRKGHFANKCRSPKKSYNRQSNNMPNHLQQLNYNSLFGNCSYRGHTLTVLP